jgi:hypothetical protein
MIAKKQESGVQFNQLIFPPVELSAAISRARGKPLDAGNDIPWSKVTLDDAMQMPLGSDALAPWCGRFLANPFLRTLCCLLKQALPLKLAGHAFA